MGERKLFRVIDGHAVAAGEPGDPTAASGHASVGTLLMNARINLGYELRDVATTLKIRFVYMQAIEDGRYGELPGPAYAVGFLRTYAEFLQLDSDAIVRQFKQEIEGQVGQPQLYFPTPVPEGRIPGGTILLIAVVFAGLSYGGWYYLTATDRSMVDLAPALPQRLVSLLDILPFRTTTPTPPSGTITRPGAASAPPATTAAHPPASRPGTAAPAPSPLAVPGPAATTSSAPAGSPIAAPARAPIGEVPLAPPAATLVLPAPAPAGNGTGAAAIGTPAAGKPATDGSATETAPATDPMFPPVQMVTPTGATVLSLNSLPRMGAPPSLVSPPPPKPANIPPPPAATAPTTATPGADMAEEVPLVSGPADETVPAGTTAGAAMTATRGTGPAQHLFGTPNQQSRIQLVATQDSWIQVRDANGELLFTRVLRPGDGFRVPDKPGIRLRTGNAGGILASVDGVETGPLGTTGQVLRDVVLDAGRLQRGVPLSN